MTAQSHFKISKSSFDSYSCWNGFCDDGVTKYFNRTFNWSLFLNTYSIFKDHSSCCIVIWKCVAPGWVGPYVEIIDFKLYTFNDFILKWFYHEMVVTWLSSLEVTLIRNFKINAPWSPEIQKTLSDRVTHIETWNTFVNKNTSLRPKTTSFLGRWHPSWIGSAYATDM